MNTQPRQPRRPQRERAAIILAAGKSTRMRTDKPKVLHEVCGRPMLSYILDACRAGGASRILVVVGYQKQQLIDHYAGQDELLWIEQREQKGTGHAVMVCEEALSDFEGTVIVIAGDMPLIRAETMQRLLEAHEGSGAAATIATTVLEDPTGYGRIVRDRTGKLLGIVEHRDCTAEQLKIKECNPSYYAFDKARLFEALSKTDNQNAKGEYYITDAVRVLVESGLHVDALEAISADEATGINSRRDLAVVGRMMQDRIQGELMDGGVTIVDPTNTWIDARAEIAPDAVIMPFCVIEGSARIGPGCRVGPFAHLRNGEVLEAEDRSEKAGGSEPGGMDATARERKGR
jgi:bifunctional UDP-N-acetylglucosamine pyrophosphorylase/glucosamine-1-phosphate N-acetyltransferase